MSEVSNPNPKKCFDRKSIRLKDYDYSQEGYYFVTVCTFNHNHLLGTIENGEMISNKYGQLVLQEWNRSEQIRKEIQLDEFVIMPNHIHGIVIINGNDTNDNYVGATGRSPLQGCPPRSLGSFMAGFKSICTARINELRKTPHMPVWQRNYFERVIRNERELYQTRQYIQYNPEMWDDDEYRS